MCRPSRCVSRPSTSTSPAVRSEAVATPSATGPASSAPTQPHASAGVCTSAARTRAEPPTCQLRLSTMCCFARIASRYFLAWARLDEDFEGERSGAFNLLRRSIRGSWVRWWKGEGWVYGGVGGVVWRHTAAAFGAAGQCFLVVRKGGEGSMR